MLTRKKHPMKREVLQKTPMLSKGCLNGNRNLKDCLWELKTDGSLLQKNKNRAHIGYFPKVNAAFICLDILPYIILINQVSNAVCVPRIVAIPIP